MVKKLSQRGLPTPMLGILSWSQSVTLKKVIQSVVEGDVIDTVYSKPFQGVVIPMENEVLMLKPTEQQSWEWYYIFTKGNVSLENNDRIEYNGIKYKIMERRDYSAYGHIEYHAIKDWQ